MFGVQKVVCRDSRLRMGDVKVCGGETLRETYSTGLQQRSRELGVTGFELSVLEFELLDQSQRLCPKQALCDDPGQLPQKSRAEPRAGSLARLMVSMRMEVVVVVIVTIVMVMVVVVVAVVMAMVVAVLMVVMVAAVVMVVKVVVAVVYVVKAVVLAQRLIGALCCVTAYPFQEWHPPKPPPRVSSRRTGGREIQLPPFADDLLIPAIPEDRKGCGYQASLGDTRCPAVLGAAPSNSCSVESIPTTHKRNLCFPKGATKDALQVPRDSCCRVGRITGGDWCSRRLLERIKLKIQKERSLFSAAVWHLTAIEALDERHPLKHQQQWIIAPDGHRSARELRRSASGWATVDRPGSPGLKPGHLQVWKTAPVLQVYMEG
ncbi:Leucine-Rich Repeat-Containing Protein 26 [Manis pentadactyla]|nr:Leucine-Rich Repeat-Containing Protein 26 [Manis pentadactyla]